ncbi:MAG: helix-turn-helix transcriptional regulator [Oscillospiraceae bacterium]|nr:helix-turn-helix transcriptional regulator [Oscillospiraceae bacterium]
METKDILKFLRERHGYTIQEVSKSIGMQYTMCREYETGNRNLGMSAAIKFADFYNVSLDYLMGRESPPSPVDEMEVLGLEKNVDDDEFIKLYDQLPDYAKQIFVNTMVELSKAVKKRKDTAEVRPKPEKDK